MTVLHIINYKKNLNLSELKQNILKNIHDLEERLKKEKEKIFNYGIGVHLSDKTNESLRELLPTKEFFDFVQELLCEEIETIFGESKTYGLEIAFYKNTDLSELEEEHYNFKYINLTLNMQYLSVDGRFENFETMLKMMNEI